MVVAQTPLHLPGFWPTGTWLSAVLSASFSASLSASLWVFARRACGANLQFPLHPHARLGRAHPELGWQKKSDGVGCLSSSGSCGSSNIAAVLGVVVGFDIRACFRNTRIIDEEEPRETSLTMIVTCHGGCRNNTVLTCCKHPLAYRKSGSWGIILEVKRSRPPPPCRAGLDPVIETSAIEAQGAIIHSEIVGCIIRAVVRCYISCI